MKLSDTFEHGFQVAPGSKANLRSLDPPGQSFPNHYLTAWTHAFLKGNLEIQLGVSKLSFRSAAPPFFKIFKKSWEVLKKVWDVSKNTKYSH